MKPEHLMAPIHEEAGDLTAEAEETEDVVAEEVKEVDIDKRPVWEKMQDEMEDLTVRVARHFEDTNDQTGWHPPMIRSPLQPTKEEWLRHQLTHTPFAAWCKHCNAGRAVRTSHQRVDKRAKLVPDTDQSVDGPVKISMDYMFMHDRIGRFIEHK